MRIELDAHPAQEDFIASAAKLSIFVGGLGSGKTFTGWLRLLHWHGKGPPALVCAPTYPMLRDVVLRTLLDQFGRLVRRVHRSEMRVELRGGAEVLLRSLDNPDSIRGINTAYLWVDEGCFVGRESLTNAIARARIGARMRAITTTPIKGSMVHELATGDAMADTRAVFVARTRDNPFISAEEEALQRAAMTPTQAARELDAEWAGGDGALWTPEDIARVDGDGIVHMQCVVVGVDPAVTSTRRSDLTGIVVVGLNGAGRAVVLEDLTGRYQPHEWARAAADAVHRYRRPDCGAYIVAESNQGGDMVETTIRATDPAVGVDLVRASGSKMDRARPVAAAYRAGRVAHSASANLHRLEAQMCSWEPGDGSPDRIDALVHAVTALEVY
jgi:phage terminase large subunit-like protein